MTQPSEKSEGLRARKRRETRRRLAETGLRLFLERGYEETTLDAIAEAAGVSRRTVFHYFDQKEDILLAWQSGMGDMIGEAILRERPDRAPVDLVLAGMLQLVGQYQAEDIVRIEKLLASTQRLDGSKHAKYAEQEQAVFEALVQLWPAADRRNALRLVAMVCVGALRLAFERWAERNGADPLAHHLRAAFAELKREIEPAGVARCRRMNSGRTSKPARSGRARAWRIIPPPSTTAACCACRSGRSPAVNMRWRR